MAGGAVSGSFLTLLDPCATRQSPERDASIAAFESINDTDSAGVLRRFTAPGFVKEGAGSYGWLQNNFFDGVFAAVHYAQRTGNQTVLANARKLVHEVWANERYSTQIVGYARTGDYTTYTSRPAPRDCATQGIALVAMDGRDATARAKARLVLSWLAWWMVRFRSTWGDQREDSYQLQALTLAAWMGLPLPPWNSTYYFYNPSLNWAAEAKKRLDIILAKQNANGSWTSAFTTGENPTYMTGMLIGSMGLYDELLGDQRILPAAVRGLEWLDRWHVDSASTNWDNHSGAGGWPYSMNPAGTAVWGGSVYPTLNGLYLDAIRYVHDGTGNRRWLDLGNAAFEALVQELANRWSNGISDGKECNQVNRGARWIQYRRTH